MDKEQKTEVLKTLLNEINIGFDKFGFKPVPKNKYLFHRILSDGCEFIRLKRVNNFSDWICVDVVFGYNPKNLLGVYDRINPSSDFYLRVPIFQRRIGALMEGVPNKEQKILRGKYSCFPLGSWEIRSAKELSKVKKILLAIKTYSPDFFNETYDEEYFSLYPPHMIGENHSSFIKLQIIAAKELDDEERFDCLRSYYEGRQDCDVKWVDDLLRI